MRPGESSLRGGGPAGRTPVEEQEFRMFGPARLLLPHYATANLRILAVDTGEGGTATVRAVEERDEAAAGVAASSRPRVVGVEIGSPGPIDGCLEAIAREALDGAAADLYFLTKTRGQLSAILRLLRKRKISPTRVYGIDPDYYYSLVPINGAGHRQAERYVLDLKRRTGKSAAAKRQLKRVLIFLNRSRPLYEGFLVVVSRGRPMESNLDLHLAE